jgi:hypothetical protein
MRSPHCILAANACCLHDAATFALQNRSSIADVEYGMRVCIGGLPDWPLYDGKGDPNNAPAGLALKSSFGRVHEPGTAASQIWRDTFIFAG